VKSIAYKLIQTLLMEAAHYRNTSSKMLFVDSLRTGEYKTPSTTPNHLIYLESLLTPPAAAGRSKLENVLLIFIATFFLCRM